MVFHEERRSRWVATVRAWKHSGQTQRVFAEREGVALDGLRRWCVRLGEAPRSSKRAAAGPRFVEVRTAAEPTRVVLFTVEPLLVVTGDPGLLRSALTNLLSNAWKFTRKATSAHVEVSALRLLPRTSSWFGTTAQALMRVMRIASSSR